MNPIALVDCNNFYVSCERVYNAKLTGKPVVVLSNNDGMAISRSEEAKALGIEMAVPIHEIRDLLEKHQVRVFSSNYALYGSLSRRVMDTLKEFSPDVEEYSIDEAFVSLRGFEGRSLMDYGWLMKQKVYQWTGIPVSIGIAPSKTLSKLANRLAKKSSKARGVLDLTRREDREEALRQVKVEDLWKCGPSRAALFHSKGFHTAWDLSRAPLEWVDKKVGVEGVRMVLELNGEPCLRLEVEKPARQGAGCAKSFGHPVESLPEIKECLASHVADCARRLRKDHQVARSLWVHLGTNPDREGPQYFKGISASLSLPTDDTGELIRIACGAVEKIYKPGYVYKRVSVNLGGLGSHREIQEDLFVKKDHERQARLMGALDEVHRSFGAGRLRYLAEGLVKGWDTRFDYRSPRYTTRWDELLTVKA